MATLAKTKKPAPGTIRAEDVRNANLTPIFSNNFQVQVSPQDVWLCFNEVNPTGSSIPRGFTVERKVNIIVTVPQFFAMLQNHESARSGTAKANAGDGGGIPESRRANS
jgi:hypothetical protein